MSDEAQIVARLVEQQRMIRELNEHYQTVTLQLEREVSSLEAELDALKRSSMGLPGRSDAPPD
jgi:uncharacterized protein Yka (UPF0111/DUF47 family)